MTTDYSARWMQPVLLVAFVCAGVALVLVIGSMAGGHHVRWTQWALPMLILGNLALMISGINQVRPRLARWLWIGSTALALTMLAAEFRILFFRAT